MGEHGGVTNTSGLRLLPGRFAVVVVRGRSMEPTLHDGDRLLVRAGPAATREVRRGRLVVVRLPGNRGPAVKRLAHTDLDGWWVERDNPTEGVDSWHIGAIPDDDRLGVVIGRIRPRPGLLRDRRAA